MSASPMVDTGEMGQDSGVAPITTTTGRRLRERRIAYFMLFRVVMLALLTVLAGGLSLAGDPPLQGTVAVLVWSTIGAGYGLTILYAKWLPKVDDLDRFAWVQTTIDVAFSAIAVYLTDGIDSGLVSLYLISVLGAATMGERRHIWATAIAGITLYLGCAGLELSGMLTPLALGASYSRPPVWDAAAMIARTTAGMAGVAILSSYLAHQLQTSASAVVNLQALNENIIRSLTSGLVTVDPRDRVMYFNPTAREILELHDTHIGVPLREIMPEIATALVGAPDGRVDLRHCLSGGRTIHLGLSRSRLFNADGVPVGHVIHFQDVTRLHDLSLRVRRNERLAALGGMAASVAHEIRNPLAAIAGSAELLASAPLGEEDGRLLAIIRRESARLSDMVSDLLAFTRPRAPVQVRIDLASAVRETTEAFAADPANRELDVRFSGAAGLEVEVDPAQLGQLLWNLLRNAAEAMDGKGRLTVEVGAEDTEATIRVSDEGKGIPRDRLETIFDPFFTTKEHGTGFGLALVHRIVHDNDGTIRVISTMGRGTVFSIAFARVASRLPADPMSPVHGKP